MQARFAISRIASRQGRTNLLLTIPKRAFGLLDPLKPIATPKDLSELTRDKITFNAIESEIIESINRQVSPIHIYSVYNLNIFIKWLFQIELWLMFFITALSAAATLKIYKRRREEALAKKGRRRRRFASQDFIPWIFGFSVFGSGLMFFLTRKRRLSTLRHLYFCPKEKKYIVEVYARRFGKIAEEAFSVGEIKFERASDGSPYFISFQMPGESRKRVVKTNGVWFTSKLIPLINKTYAVPLMESEKSG